MTEAATKILFVVPPHLTFQDFTNPPYNARHVLKKNGKYYGNLLTDMPLGILSLSAYVKKYSTTEIEPRLIDFSVEMNQAEDFPYRSFREYFEFAIRSVTNGVAPDIVGISALFSPSYYSLLDIANVCRELFPDSIIVAGGSVCSTMYRQILNDTDTFNALCYGEGDKPFLGLVDAEDRRTYLDTSTSWVTKRKIEAGFQPVHDFVENLDEIPFYDYGLCSVEKYGVNPAITAYAGVSEKGNNYHVMTSLGCPFHCTFCASHKVHGRKMRYYSISRIKEDFQLLREKYGAKTLVVQDDHFMGDPDRALEIVNILGDLGLKAVFQNGLAMYALKREFLEALKKSGVENLLLSIESGNESVLKKIMKKPLKLPIVQRVVDDCRELGIYTNANIIIGMPGETPEDIETGRTFLNTISPNWFMIFCTSPLVGSEMYEVALSKGYLKEGYIGSDYKRAVIETEDFTAEYIQEMSYILNLELNFVNNSDMRLGEYETALKGLENAIRAKHDHAMAFYYAGQCYEKLGRHDLAEKYSRTAQEIYSKSPFWKRYFEMFGVTPGVDDTQCPSDKISESVPTPPRRSSHSKSIFGYRND